LSSKSRIAQVLAGSPAAFDSQGLEQPPEVTQAILGMLVPPLLQYAGSAMAEAPEKLASEAGAVFPEETAPEMLPPVQSGSKTGDPHALFAYNDNFGPDMSQRSIYNVFGDPSDPVFQKTGWGSSLPAESLKKFGIPITGRQVS
jgi:hypothetical protein